jgi:hypothetical protein
MWSVAPGRDRLSVPVWVRSAIGHRTWARQVRRGQRITLPFQGLLAWFGRIALTVFVAKNLLRIIRIAVGAGVQTALNAIICIPAIIRNGGLGGSIPSCGTNDLAVCRLRVRHFLSIYKNAPKTKRLAATEREPVGSRKLSKLKTGNSFNDRILVGLLAKMK